MFSFFSLFEEQNTTTRSHCVQLLKSNCFFNQIHNLCLSLFCFLSILYQGPCIGHFLTPLIDIVVHIPTYVLVMKIGGQHFDNRLRSNSLPVSDSLAPKMQTWVKTVLKAAHINELSPSAGIVQQLLESAYSDLNCWWRLCKTVQQRKWLTVELN